MPRSRKSYPPSLKVRVVVEALKEQKTAAEIAQVYGIHPTMVGNWKKQALEGLPSVFEQPRSAPDAAGEAERDELYRQIGRLQVELAWLKKKSGLLS
jgi:transposase